MQEHEIAQAKLQYQQHMNKVKSGADAHFVITDNDCCNNFQRNLWLNTIESNIIEHNIAEGRQTFELGVADRASLAIDSATKAQRRLLETIDNYEKLVKKLTGQVQEFAARVQELEAQLEQHLPWTYEGTDVVTGAQKYLLTPAELLASGMQANVVSVIKGRGKTAYGCFWRRFKDIK